MGGQSVVENDSHFCFSNRKECIEYNKFLFFGYSLYESFLANMVYFVLVLHVFLLSENF